MPTAPILLVDDEHHVRSALRRVFELAGLPVLTASCADEAGDVLRDRTVSVLVCDNRMPGGSGVDLLARARALQPDTTRIMLTGHADLPTAIDAINRGEVYRLVLKPWNDGDLLAVVQEARERRRLVQALSTGDEATIRSLAQAVELKDHYTAGHCDRVARYASLIAVRLGLDEETQRDLRWGSWLHDCGKIGVPESILNFPGPLDPTMRAVIDQHPAWGADIARRGNLPKAVVDIILHHHERVDGAGYPGRLRGAEIPLLARIVGAADVYDAMTSDRAYKRGLSPEDGRRELYRLRGTALDPEITGLLLDQLRAGEDSRTALAENDTPETNHRTRAG